MEREATSGYHRLNRLRVGWGHIPFGECRIKSTGRWAAGHAALRKVLRSASDGPRLNRVICIGSYP
jgi:hypothetical protein